MFMLLLSLVAAILFFGGCSCVGYCLVRLYKTVRGKDYKEVGITVLVLVALILFCLVQKQAILRIVPQISVW